MGQEDKNAADIPAQVAEDFLAALLEQKVAPEIVQRLQAVLAGEARPSKQAMADALFAEDLSS